MAFGAIIGIFIGGAYFFGLEPTKLDLNSGENLFNSQMTELNQSGTTEPFSTVTINGENVPVDKNGNFYKVIKLKEGKNVVNVTAKAPFKSKTETFAIATVKSDKNGTSGDWSWNGTVETEY